MSNRNLEVVLKKAAVDEQFRDQLLQKRSEALRGHKIELDESERAMLDAVPEEQLRQMIRLTPVTTRERSLLKTTVLTAGIVASVYWAGGPIIATLGIRPDSPHYGRSATRSRLSNLKSALLAFNIDVGLWPIPGGLPYSSDAVKEANDRYLGPTFASNILVNPHFDVSVFFPHRMSAESAENANRRFQQEWKGPYMEGSPDEFMAGYPDGLIRLVLHDHAIYLHHSGRDNKADPMELVIAEGDYEGDDLVLRISRVLSRSVKEPQTP